MVAYERWSLTRGGRKGRFDCITKLAKKYPVTKQPITINKQATKQIVTIGKSLSRDLGIPVSVVFFVACQPLRVFRTRGSGWGWEGGGGVQMSVVS